jgi:hypothetical protein
MPKAPLFPQSAAVFFPPLSILQKVVNPVAFPTMKISVLRLAGILAFLSATLCSCSSSDHSKLEKRLDERNTEYQNYQDRRALRQQARQERTDAWYDRAMGKPPKGDTGLKLPGEPPQQ